MRGGVTAGGAMVRAPLMVMLSREGESKRARERWKREVESSTKGIDERKRKNDDDDNARLSLRAPSLFFEV